MTVERVHAVTHPACGHGSAPHIVRSASCLVHLPLTSTMSSPGFVELCSLTARCCCSTPMARIGHKELPRPAHTMRWSRSACLRLCSSAEREWSMLLRIGLGVGAFQTQAACVRKRAQITILGKFSGVFRHKIIDRLRGVGECSVVIPIVRAIDDNVDT